MTLQGAFDFDAPPITHKTPAPKTEPVIVAPVIAPEPIKAPAVGLAMTRPRFAPVGAMPDLSVFWLFPRKRVETPSPEVALGALVRWQMSAVETLASVRKRGEDETYALKMLACVEAQLLERYRWAYAYGIEDRHSKAIVAIQRRESRMRGRR